MPSILAARNSVFVRIVDLSVIINMLSILTFLDLLMQRSQKHVVSANLLQDTASVLDLSSLCHILMV